MNDLPRFLDHKDVTMIMEAIYKPKRCSHLFTALGLVCRSFCSVRRFCPEGALASSLDRVLRASIELFLALALSVPLNSVFSSFPDC